MALTIDDEKVSQAIAQLVEMETNIAGVRAALPLEAQRMLSNRDRLNHIYPKAPALPAFKGLLSFTMAKLDKRFVPSEDLDFQKLGFRAGVAVRGSLSRANDFWASSLETIATPYVKVRHWWESGERRVSFFGTRRHVDAAKKKFSATLAILSIESKDLSPVLLGTNIVPERLNVAGGIEQNLAKEGWQNKKWEVLDSAPPAYRNDLAYKMIWPRLKSKLADAAGLTMTINALQRSDYWIVRAKEVAQASGMEVGALSYALLMRPDWVADLPKGKELVSHRKEVLASADKYAELLQRVLTLSRAYVSSIDALTPYLKEEQTATILKTQIAEFGEEKYSYAVFKARVESIPVVESFLPAEPNNSSRTLSYIVTDPEINRLLQGEQLPTTDQVVPLAVPAISPAETLVVSAPIAASFGASVAITAPAPAVTVSVAPIVAVEAPIVAPVVSTPELTVAVAEKVSLPTAAISSTSKAKAVPFSPFGKTKVAASDDQFANLPPSSSIADDDFGLPEDDTVSTAFPVSPSPHPKM